MTPWWRSKRLEEGTDRRVVVVIPAVEAGAITFTCPLEVSVGEIPRIPLGCTWTIHALAPNSRTSVPTTGKFQRRRPLVSFLVSKSFGNQQSSPVLEREVGVSRKDQPISCFMTFSVRRRSSIWESVSKFHDRLPQGQSITAKQKSSLRTSGTSSSPTCQRNTASLPKSSIGPLVGSVRC